MVIHLAVLRLLMVSFRNNIALSNEGLCFTDKILNAQNAGATGVIIFTNTNPPGGMAVEGTSIQRYVGCPWHSGDEIAAWVNNCYR